MSSSISDLLVEGRSAKRRSPGDIGSFVQGTVTENNDKKYPAMVKVEFTSWTSGKNICEWIPLLHSYAGKGYGEYILPEIGDVVLLGFMGAAQTKAFVMGVLYPANSTFTKESFEKKNLTKRFKTKGGIDLALNDENGKESVTVITPKEQQIVVDDEKECITVSDKTAKNIIKLDSKNGALEITTEKKITFKAGKCEITMDGQGGAITIKGAKITADAQQTVKISGKQSLALEGGMLKAEGKQTTTIKGGTMTQVSGQILKLN